MLNRLVVHGLLGAALLGGCYRAARPFAPERFDREPGWVAVSSVPVIRQREIRDCGAAVAAMLLGYWGMPATQDKVRAASGVSLDHGLRADFLRAHLRDQGLQAFLFEGNFGDLEHELARGRPVLVGVITAISNDVYAHYMIVVGVNRAREQIVVIDPAEGVNVYSFAGFMRKWMLTQFLTIAVAPAPAPTTRPKENAMTEKNPMETVKGTPGSAEPTEDEKKTAANQEAEARTHEDEGSAGRKPGEADAPVLPRQT